MTNQVVIIGRLVRTPEITKLDNGKTVSNITVAVSRTIKKIMVNMKQILLIVSYGMV